MSWITPRIQNRIPHFFLFLLVSFSLSPLPAMASTIVYKTEVAPSTETPSKRITSALDATEDYVREIFGTPVVNHVSAAEAVVNPQPLKDPLPENIINNGPPPVPHDNVGTYPPDYSAFRTFRSRDLLWPMRGGLVSSRYGMRWGRMHHGTDISAPYGTPILAAGDGKVIFSGWQTGYGQLVIVDHGNGVKTKYGHCSKLLASVGEAVHQGDIIGRVGATGHATGPHLHYEVIHEGKSNNPENFTRRR